MLCAKWGNLFGFQFGQKNWNRGTVCGNSARTDLVCHESKKDLLVTVGKMEDGPPATISRSSCQTTVSCVD